MEIISGSVDNVMQGYEHQTTRKGRKSSHSHHTVSFTLDNKQAHFRTHHPPSINPGDQITIAGITKPSGFNVCAFSNKSNGTFGTYYLVGFYWLAVAWLVIAVLLFVIDLGFFLIVSPLTIAAGVYAYLGYSARQALKLCQTTAPEQTT